MSDTATLSDRAVRQRALVPPDRLAACQAIVIGVGAIGRQVALQLAAVGVPRMILIDHDVVSVENLAPQGYWEQDLGSPKVAATAGACRRCFSEILITSLPERFRRSLVRHLSIESMTVIFCCVDSIATRRLIWETLGNRVALFVDGRMSAEVMRILAVDCLAAAKYYFSTLFAAEEAFVGSCTARSTIYTASIAAGLMVTQLAKWLRCVPVDADLTLNLLAAELTPLILAPSK